MADAKLRARSGALELESILPPGVGDRMLLLCLDSKGNGARLNLLLAKNACNACNACMQYTIRNVPEYLDAALRVAAREQGKSLNEVAIEALARGFGLGEPRVR